MKSGPNLHSQGGESTYRPPAPGLKDRLAALQNVPRFLALVWRISSTLTFTNLLLRILQSALPLTILYVGKLIINEVVSLSQGKLAGGSSHVWQLVGIEAGLGLLLGALWTGVALVDGLLAELVTNQMSVRIMEHAGTLDLEQFEDSSFYDRLERARQQSSGRRLLLGQVFGQFQQLLTMAFLSIALISFHPWLLLLIALAVLPAIFSEYYFNNKHYALIRSQTSGRRSMEYFRHVGASDEHAKEVRIFELAPFLVERFRSISSKFFHDNRHLALRRSAMQGFSTVIATASYYAGYVVIVKGVIQGSLTVGDLSFLAGSFYQMRALLQNVLAQFSSITMGAVYLRDFFEFFEMKPQIVAPARARPFPKPIKQGFRFENVSFKYRQAETYSIREITFSLAAGEKLALVGANGAGKSTLVKLMARLYDPTSGRILLDGYDLREYDPAELRSEIGVIFQDFLRYQMTTSENIAVGEIGEIENHARILSSARKSLAHGIIDQMPGGYQQVLGRRFEHGIELSGGEWQKIALARAYMRDAQLLILDEPTAALDANAEHEVFQRFSELTKEKTAVLVSHRFSTVRMADRILVLDGGRLIETGSHEDLLKNGGTYAALFELQATAYR